MNLIGQTLAGRYYIESHIGKGGMAVVYRARDVSLNRDVAIKVLPREFLHDSTFRERFTQEAQTVAGLEHPSIVPIHDFGEEDGQPYFVMRYMPGGSLADRIAGGPLLLEDVSQIIDRIGAALDAAHTRAIIHRDVKPGNILFDSYNEAYLSDFGIVRLTESTAHLTGSGIVGTPAYMAPELAGKGGLTPSVDTYALGVTLFQILTGFQPFEADTPMGLIMAHVSRPIPNIRSVRPDLPENLQSVINRALAKDSTNRYQTAGELADGLRLALTGAVSVRQDGPAVAPAPEAYLPLETQPDLAYTLPEVAPTLREIAPAPAAPVLEKPPSRRKPWLWAIVGGGIGLIALVSVIIVVLVGKFAQPTEPAQEIMESVAEEPSDTPEPTEEPTETPLPTESPEPTETPLPPGFIPVKHNSDWEPVIEEINGVPMVLVPAGCFQMGSSQEEFNDAFAICNTFLAGSCEQQWLTDSMPRHEVCFTEPFWIDVYEVSNAQYGSSGYWTGDTLPREQVSWHDALNHCETRGARLPTEAEWEYASRGPDGLLYPWGNVFDGRNANYCDVNCSLDWRDTSTNDGYAYTAPVGSCPGGKSWVGAHDLSGNVWEWVNDWYDPGYYASSPVDNPQGAASGEYRVMRGGGWGNLLVSMRGADRDWNPPDYSWYLIGFRCALSYSPEN